MSLDSDSFLALCKELRKLGACKVEGYGFSAVFTPVPSAPTVPVATPARTPRKTAARGAEPSDEELRELARRRELGLG